LERWDARSAVGATTIDDAAGGLITLCLITLCLSPGQPPPVGIADLMVNPLFTREPLAVVRDRLPDAGMDAEVT
jgi:hypothetical protein